MTEKTATILVTPKTGACPALAVDEANNSAGVSVTPVSETREQLHVPDSSQQTVLFFKGQGLQNIECLPRSNFEVTIDQSPASSTDMGYVTVKDNGVKGKFAFMLKIDGRWHDPQIYNTGGGG